MWSHAFLHGTNRTILTRQEPQMILECDQGMSRTLRPFCMVNQLCPGFAILSWVDWWKELPSVKLGRNHQKDSRICSEPLIFRGILLLVLGRIYQNPRNLGISWSLDDTNPLYFFPTHGWISDPKAKRISTNLELTMVRNLPNSTNLFLQKKQTSTKSPIITKNPISTTNLPCNVVRIWYLVIFGSGDKSHGKLPFSWHHGETTTILSAQVETMHGFPRITILNSTVILNHHENIWKIKFQVSKWWFHGDFKW